MVLSDFGEFALLILDSFDTREMEVAAFLILMFAVK
jgi:hypothetical protein